MSDDDRDGTDTRLSGGGWLAIVVLAGFLGWAIWYAAHAWGALAGVGITPVGWVMLGLGVVVTLIVGGGLMALLFYSSRKDYDR
jgi:hypothetical protein